ncbi:unnamed protein product [Allacma fusca]|uniref:Uncharacterized protein n=1 Tax=Allacma fusca TaxID=39272 RepID=A0A8J2K0A8_9HEXA|nr:unnamed protein product [Allacma fusca]
MRILNRKLKVKKTLDAVIVLGHSRQSIGNYNAADVDQNSYLLVPLLEAEKLFTKPINSTMGSSSSMYMIVWPF